MADDDWYRRTRWTETDRTEFFARLKRSRGQHSKSQYLRIQASYLAGIDTRAALELLQLIVDEFPEPRELAQTRLQIAHCRLRLGEPEAAIEEFRRALAQERLYPKALTQAYLDFATFAIANQRRDLYDEIAGILREYERWAMFPIDRYRFHTALSVIADARGDVLDAAKHARVALAAAEKKDSGLRSHPAVGLVRERDETLQARLIELARLG